MRPSVLRSSAVTVWKGAAAGTLNLDVFSMGASPVCLKLTTTLPSLTTVAIGAMVAKASAKVRLRKEPPATRPPPRSRCQLHLSKMPDNLVDSLSMNVSDSGRTRKRPERFAGFANDSDSDDDGQPKRRRAAPRPRGDGESGRKKMRCGQCAGCQAKNCGKCVNCKDMPKFGGKGTIRQTCKERACEVLTELQREAALVKATERAEESAERAKERALERQEREAERQLAATKRAEAKRTEREEKLIERGAARQSSAVVRTGPIGKGRGVRTPTVTLEEGMGGGWGEHELEPGCAVEVRLEEEGLEETFYAGKIVLEKKEKKTRKQAGAGEHSGQVHVEFDELLEDNESEARLREWTNRDRVRLKPPPTPPGFFGLLQRGDKLQLLYLSLIHI